MRFGRVAFSSSPRNKVIHLVGHSHKAVAIVGNGFDCAVMASQLIVAGKVEQDNIRIFSENTYCRVDSLYPFYLNDLLDYDRLNVPLVRLTSEHIDMVFDKPQEIDLENNIITTIDSHYSYSHLIVSQSPSHSLEQIDGLQSVREEGGKVFVMNELSDDHDMQVHFRSLGAGERVCFYLSGDSRNGLNIVNTAMILGSSKSSRVEIYLENA